MLAVNEALANTAEFAYLLKGGGVGTIDVEAVRDGDNLTVTIADQVTGASPRPPHRVGRAAAASR